jgi:hypothetical protein
MRSSLLASVDVIEFQTTDTYSSLDLNNNNNNNNSHVVEPVGATLLHSVQWQNEPQR